jgi:glycosyltransferase involved in cell wall biosynthesis
VPWIANRFVPRGDVVLATSWPVAHDVAAFDASRGRKVHVVFHHESGTGPEERVAAIYRLPFHRMTLSRVVRDSVASRFGCEIHDVVPAGVDTARFFPDGERVADTVLMLYHNDPRKGADDGIRALTRLRERHPRVRVRMCGTVIPAGLPSWIDYDFHPPDAALRRCYSSSTAFLYPSRYEGFGLPPLEAMACGCPVVTTDVGAVSEFAEDGGNALVARPGDVAGLADRLERVLRDRTLASGLTARGLETAARHAVQRVAPAFGEALSRVASR